VRAIEYQGTWVKVTLEGVNGEDFVANMLDSEFFGDPFNSGDVVRAYWMASDVHPLVATGPTPRDATCAAQRRRARRGALCCCR
jgi:TOBE domain-containing protein